MSGKSFVVFGRSWSDVSVLGDQVFGQASMESCEGVGGEFGVELVFFLS